MTKVELIRKIAKNAGIPDADAKIFFELFLKRISTIVEVGQSIFVKDFGYFHLIKGSIKKPVFSFKDNEVSEEDVELILFSENKDLRKSDTKGLVFNIPIIEEEDYHPIDSTFSLSIGKPLIPLSGVPFDDVFIPASGYEYRRLIESKVEKIIGESDIEDSVENFPTLVIDARSYNSNQVQLQWEDKTALETETKISSTDPTISEAEPEVSQYEKQSKELKNIVWDFGEDLSKQIEAESILDIADERIKMDINQPKEVEKTEPVENLETEFKLDSSDSVQENLIPEQVQEEIPEFVEDVNLDESADKLNELLNDVNEKKNVFEEEIIEENILENFDSNIDVNTDEQVEEKIAELNEEQIDEIITEPLVEQEIESERSDLIDEIVLDDPSDKDFWKSTSKYFTPYKPDSDKSEGEVQEQYADSEQVQEMIQSTSGGQDEDSFIDLDVNSENEETIVSGNETINEVITSEINEEEPGVKMEEDSLESNIEENIELEKQEEQKAEYFEPEKKRNIIPFIIFPLIVIGLSIALYWYLEYYKKGEITKTPKTEQIVLKTENVKIVQRDFDIPVTYPYMPKPNETTISADLTPQTEEPIVQKVESDDKKIEEKKPESKPEIKSELKPEIKEITKQPIVENKIPVQNTTPTSTALNVGNNIYKYGNYFVVQVASFRAKSISENEAGKYRNKGFNAFVEEAEIPGRGIWYRVRIGNFSTKEEAQIFANKNIR